MKRKNYLKLITITTFLVSFVMAFLLSMPQALSNNSAFALEPIQSKACCLIEQNTGKVLMEKESKKHLPIASVTKTMTLLLTFEAIEEGKFGFEDLLFCSRNASGMGGSQVFLDFDVEYKVEDLLYAIVMSSANDASVVFAEAIAGSEEGFVSLMNKKVQDLGLCDTNFVNCTGLPANNHYSCAYDVAKIMQELVRHEDYFKYTKERLRDFVHPSGRITQMTNTNKLVQTYKACDAGKTGSTVEAGYCLSATAMKNNMRLIGVVLGAENSKQRFSDCERIFDYGFNNFETKCVVDASREEIFGNTVKHSKQKEIFISPERSYFEVVKKGEDFALDVRTELFDVSAPLMKGECVGKIYVTKNNEVLDEINLILCNDVEEKSFFDCFKEMLLNW